MKYTGNSFNAWTRRERLQLNDDNWRAGGCKRSSQEDHSEEVRGDETLFIDPVVCILFIIQYVDKSVFIYGEN